MVMDEGRRLAARRVADELLGVLELERSLGATRALLVAGLVDLHDEVPDSVVEGAERLVPSGHEGTPLVAEFCFVELAALLQVSVPAAASVVADVMDLRHRLPLTWAALLAGRVELWQARQVAQAKGMGALSPGAAAEVDRRLEPCLGRLSWGRVMRKLAGLVVVADTAAAAARVEKARAEQFVRVSHEGDGMSTLVARLRTSGALLIEAAVHGMSKQMVAEGRSEPIGVLRAEALVGLATPTDASDAAGTLRRPTSTVVVHVGRHTEVARVEGQIGPVLKEHLAELLQHHRIRLLPVVDLAADPQVDSYEVPAHIGRHVSARDLYEMFPFSKRAAGSGTDADHTVPWRDDGTPGQTCPSNLGYLSRLVHRAKTHGGFDVEQPEPGVFAWLTRLGYEWSVDRRGTHPRGDVPNAGEGEPAGGIRVDIVFPAA